MKKFDIQMKMLFRIRNATLPSYDEQLKNLWRFAKALEKTDLSIDQWHPAAPTERESLAHEAFDASGPTQAALHLANSNNADDPDLQTVGVWNGKEGSNGMVFTTLIGLKNICTFDFDADDVQALSNYSAVAGLIESALTIWPASCLEVAPFKYGIRQMRVFPDRPGVGWMLYLPHEIAHERMPEARMLRYITDVNGHKGTIVISEIDGVFDADNPAHVHTANKIEIRLADRGLLPKYADL